MDFKKFIGENHPDPDTLLLNNFEQMCILAEKYAETLQLRKTDVIPCCKHEYTSNYLNSDSSFSHTQCDDCGETLQ